MKFSEMILKIDILLRDKNMSMTDFYSDLAKHEKLSKYHDVALNCLDSAEISPEEYFETMRSLIEELSVRKNMKPLVNKNL